jgi:hypothetical protein
VAGGGIQLREAEITIEVGFTVVLIFSLSSDLNPNICLGPSRNEKS